MTCILGGGGMVLYSVILFLTAAIFMAVSISIYKGNTKLIHDYHQTKVTDPASYGKAFGKALSVIAAALLLSGIIGLGDNSAVLAVAVLMIGLMIGMVCIIAVQRKYNKGIF